MFNSMTKYATYFLIKPILWSVIKVTDSSEWPYTSKKAALSRTAKGLGDIIC